MLDNRSLLSARRESPPCRHRKALSLCFGLSISWQKDRRVPISRGHIYWDPVEPDLCRTAAPQRADPRRPSSGSPVARRTPGRSHPDHRVARHPRGQKRALDPNDAVPCVHVPRSGGSRDGGSASARVLHQAPDRPADALVSSNGAASDSGAGSGSSRTPLIHPALLGSTARDISGSKSISLRHETKYPILHVYLTIRGRIPAFFPRLAAGAFFTRLTETISRPISRFGS